MTLFLSININLIEYSDLIKNKNFISNSFKSRISLFNANYRLIGLVTQPSDDHFISYFENNKDLHENHKIGWFKYDDFAGYFNEIHNTEIALGNIRQTEGISLLIYLKI